MYLCKFVRYISYCCLSHSSIEVTKNVQTLEQTFPPERRLAPSKSNKESFTLFLHPCPTPPSPLVHSFSSMTPFTVNPCIIWAISPHSVYYILHLPHTLLPPSPSSFILSPLSPFTVNLCRANIPKRANPWKLLSQGELSSLSNSQISDSCQK